MELHPIHLSQQGLGERLAFAAKCFGLFTAVDIGSRTSPSGKKTPILSRSTMKILQVFTRIYLEPGKLDQAIAFYECLFAERCQLRFQYPEAGLELAAVGSFLLLMGSERALLPFKPTKATFLVDSLNQFREAFSTIPNVVILQEPKQVPTGFNMRVLHPDGTAIEYVEFV
jgi:hypothetical protein